MLSKKKILIAESENQLLKTMRMVVRSAGHEVEVARNDREVFDKISLASAGSNNYDLFIADLQISNGEEMIDMALTVDSISLVMVVSGYDECDVAFSLVRRGCQGFVTKPFTADELLEKVNKILEREAPLIRKAS